ncbi:LPXTG cell wall anchor domain-containing protein [Streptomyces sp. CNQ085]|uniref:LPXTG cell wall anchor domain-containing protein n=1 Tax=Streptomyces sp. CNQ085 TaxID=2886944 RepID=UPI001F507986|nr:LPXTG cell wall anchor domain-containing protein [Streptomyces sp. CNQ085]MCI0386508.1 LPXTG cell wall anchor domain-containing protein [Streptomyces sp. CNQ085]
MTDSRTRVRVARVAAGAVFLAGVSLTAVGTASAVGVDAGLSVMSGSSGGDGNEISGVNGDPGEPEPTEPEPTEPEPTEPEPTEPEPTEPEPTEPEPTEPEPTEPEPTEPEPTEPEPTEPEPTEPEPTDPTTPPTDGEEPASTGGTGGGDGGPNTCILDESTVDCGPGTDSVGTRPVSQEKPKEELAETGAAETTFLLIGAATMIAGGVGFRLMPRLANRDTVA